MKIIKERKKRIVYLTAALSLLLCLFLLLPSCEDTESTETAASRGKGRAVPEEGILIVTGKINAVNPPKSLYIEENWMTRSKISFRVVSGSEESIKKILESDQKIITVRGEVRKISTWSREIKILEILEIKPEEEFPQGRPGEQKKEEENRSGS